MKVQKDIATTLVDCYEPSQASLTNTENSSLPVVESLKRMRYPVGFLNTLCAPKGEDRNDDLSHGIRAQTSLQTVIAAAETPCALTNALAEAVQLRHAGRTVNSVQLAGLGVRMPFDILSELAQREHQELLQRKHLLDGKIAGLGPPMTPPKPPYVAAVAGPKAHGNPTYVPQVPPQLPSRPLEIAVSTPSTPFHSKLSRYPLEQALLELSPGWGQLQLLSSPSFETLATGSTVLKRGEYSDDNHMKLGLKPGQRGESPISDSITSLHWNRNSLQHLNTHPSHPTVPGGALIRPSVTGYLSNIIASKPQRQQITDTLPEISVTACNHIYRPVPVTASTLHPTLFRAVGVPMNVADSQSIRDIGVKSAIKLNQSRSMTSSTLRHGHSMTAPVVVPSIEPSAWLADTCMLLLALRAVGFANRA